MKPFDYYSKPKTLFPNKEDYTTVFVYDKGKVVWQGNQRDFRVANFSKDIVVQKVLNQDDYSAHRDDYYEELAALSDEFTRDLFEEFDVTNNPKAPLCYSKAYELGHAYGFSEVYSVFEDLVELIK